MIPPGFTRPSQANTTHGSQVNDEDMIKEQLQAEYYSQPGSHQNASSTKAKRKARDLCEGSPSGVEDHPREKRKKERKKDSAKVSDRHPSETFRELEAQESDKSPFEGIDRSNRATNCTKQVEKSFRSVELSDQHPTEPHPTGAKKIESKTNEKDKDQCDSVSSTIAERIQFGSNREALLKSILKDCSPDKLRDIKAENLLRPNSDTRNASALSKSSSNLKSSKNRSRSSHVSMVPTLPEGYKPGPKSFHCPVRGCEKVYTRRSTLGEHMNTFHDGQYLNDNCDGTMSIISPEDYKAEISSGNNRSIIKITKAPRAVKVAKATELKAHSIKQDKAPPVIKGFHEGSVDTETSPMSKTNNVEAAKIIRRPSGPNDSLGVAREVSSKPTTSEPDTSASDSPTSQRCRRLSISSRIKSPTIKTHRPSSAGSHSKIVNGVHRDNSESIMEDWEIEPGTIGRSEAASDVASDGDSESELNIAFSSVYMDSAENGIKFPGVHFQICRIPPGVINTPYTTVPHQRICSVAAGKVQIEIGGKDFSIGVHGMWRIRAGEMCKVTNRYYAEAVIHVSTFKEA